MNYKYNELDYAKLVYENGFQTKHIPTELRLVAIYMKTILGYKPKKLREQMYNFCEKNIPEYNRVKHYKFINKAINQASKKTSVLVKIDKIDIYDYEVNYINSLNICDGDGVIPEFEYDCKKIVFTLLCQMKINQIITKIKNGVESSGMYFKGGNRKYNDLKKTSKIISNLDISNEIMYTLGQCNIITPMFNGLIKLNFMDDIKKLSDKADDKIVSISVVNFDSIGWYFDYFNNKDKMKLCKHCNQPFKQTKNDILYCNEHKQYYQPIETKTIKCIEPDCGKEFEVDARNMTKIRCDECQKIIDKQKTRLRVQKYRNKDKM
jgi:hypothetical protein